MTKITYELYSLQSVDRGHLAAVCRVKVIQDVRHHSSPLTLEIGIQAFQHQTDAISDKQQPNHRRCLLQCVNC